jgi:hypothetical protein
MNPVSTGLAGFEMSMMYTPPAPRLVHAGENCVR